MPTQLLPHPSQEGIEKMITLYREQFNMELSYEDAYEILGGVMRFIYLTEIKPVEEEVQTPAE